MSIQNIPEQINRIVTAFSEGRFDETIALIEPLLAIIGNEAALYNIAGAAYAGAGRLDAAIAHYDRAIALQPACADAHSNRGIALREQGRLDEALLSYDLAIRHQPQFPSAFYNRGNLLQQMRRFDEALGSFAQAIIQKPDYAEAHINSGNILQESGRLQEAVTQFSHAITLRPDLAAAHVNRGNALHELKQLDRAVADYRTAITLDPHSDDVRARLSFLKAHMCDWSEEADPIDIAALGVHRDAVTPFNMLSLDDDPARNLMRSVKWAEHRYPARLSVPAHARRRPERLRIGYFSADFQSHATMWLMGSLLEAHDRERFEVHAFSYGPDSHDVMRKRVIDTSDAFHDVRMLGDAAVAERARGLGIDIAVDLKGYTQNSRLGIFAHGAAPIQMSYLGYPGSSGAGFFDYAIADSVVIPAEKRPFYSEKILALPHSYQVNDDQRPIADDVPSREASGLPREGFVFCCFNNSFKITPDAFGCWMRLLGQVEGSVLWLLRDNDWAKANLRAEAERHGIAADRITFADRMPMAAHLARHAHADLFLDTFAYNAHTTASDALWAGIPLVTKLGQGFAARVGASLLQAIGLPELITRDIQAYEQLALDLAKSPERIATLKANISARRLTSPLFDTRRFARDLERGYDLAFDRQVRGLEPDHIDVPPVAGSDAMARIAA
ncbi:O-linked N-acetylglucosamine transferase, SPINDLY family protein [Sphingomonas sp. SRS2]|uniref:O-linked N-acetylglucosamine transferase, SPINDLY family protein n=1 Tax=Sphingomonas sp. SRS2 TaxID=133190 RepID=UPI0006968A9A|nr:glycosyltransferase family 41 protein [Sphingomonas sp. SRS2]